MRLAKLLGLILLSASCALAQGGNLGSNATPTVNQFGVPVPSAHIAVCKGLATTTASITSNTVTLTMASNPTTAGFTVGSTVIVADFTGSDFYLNGSYTATAVGASTIQYFLAHANATASTNGDVTQQGNTTTACLPLASVYQDPALSTSASNPFQSDGSGNWNVYAAPGNYQVQFYAAGLITAVKPITVDCVPNATSACTGALASNNTWTGNNTFTGNFQSKGLLDNGTITASEPTVFDAANAQTVQDGSGNLRGRFVSGPNTGVTNGAFQFYAELGTVPTSSFPLGNDFIAENRGPADLRYEATHAYTTTTATLSIGANTSVLVGAVSEGSTSLGVLQVGTTSLFSQTGGHRLFVARDTANFESLIWTATSGCPSAGTWNVVDATHLCLNTTKTHSGTTDVEDGPGSLLLRQRIIQMSNTVAPSQELFVPQVLVQDANGNNTFAFPSDITATYPNGQLAFYGGFVGNTATGSREPFFSLQEGSASVSATGYDDLRADSVSHRWVMSNNNGADDKVVGQNTVDTLSNKSIAQSNSPTNPPSGSDLLNFDTSDNFKPVTSTGAVAGAVFSSLNKVVYADQEPGATADVKIAACFAALPSGGTCDARGFGATTQSIAATVTIPANVTLLCDPATEFQPSTSSLTMYALSPGAEATGCGADVTNQASWSGKVFSFTGDYREGTFTRLSNYHINGTGITTGYGIYISSTGPSQAVAFLSIGHGKIEGLQYPEYLTCSGANGFINGNNFYDFTSDKGVYGWYQTSSNSSCNIGNEIWGYVFQAGASSVNSIKMVGTASNENIGSTFKAINLFDTATPISIDSSGTGNSFDGRWDGTVSDSGTLDNFLETRDWSINGTPNFTNQVTFSKGTGVAPFLVSSTTPVSNLTVENGYHFVLQQDASPSNPAAGFDRLNFDTSDIFGPLTSAGAFTRSKWSGLIATGTATLTGTGACATNSTQKGGAWAGQATCTGTTGASTFIITPGTTAPNGWSCTASDLTTAANILRQSAVSTTACTIAGTVNANDILTFTAVAY